jgi:hypothetical protein
VIRAGLAVEYSQDLCNKKNVSLRIDSKCIVSVFEVEVSALK